MVPFAFGCGGTIWCLLLLVAEVGLEPHDLRVMSPTSYQLLHSAVLCYDYVAIAVKTGAGDRGRTGTILAYHWILSPRRLPVPPHRHRKTLFFHRPHIIPSLAPFVNSFVKKESDGAFPLPGEAVPGGDRRFFLFLSCLGRP